MLGKILIKYIAEIKQMEPTSRAASFLRFFLMNLRRCFWFMQEAAWMCVSTFLTL